MSASYNDWESDLSSIIEKTNQNLKLLRRIGEKRTDDVSTTTAASTRQSSVSIGGAADLRAAVHHRYATEDAAAANYRPRGIPSTASGIGSSNRHKFADARSVRTTTIARDTNYDSDDLHSARSVRRAASAKTLRTPSAATIRVHDADRPSDIPNYVIDDIKKSLEVSIAARSSAFEKRIGDLHTDFTVLTNETTTLSHKFGELREVVASKLSSVPGVLQSLEANADAITRLEKHSAALLGWKVGTDQDLFEVAAKVKSLSALQDKMAMFESNLDALATTLKNRPRHEDKIARLQDQLAVLERQQASCVDLKTVENLLAVRLPRELHDVESRVTQSVAFMTDKLETKLQSVEKASANHRTEAIAALKSELSDDLQRLAVVSLRKSDVVPLQHAVTQLREDFAQLSSAVERSDKRQLDTKATVAQVRDELTETKQDLTKALHAQQSRVATTVEDKIAALSSVAKNQSARLEQQVAALSKKQKRSDDAAKVQQADVAALRADVLHKHATNHAAQQRENDTLRQRLTRSLGELETLAHGKRELERRFAKHEKQLATKLKAMQNKLEAYESRADTERRELMQRIQDETQRLGAAQGKSAVLEALLATEKRTSRDTSEQLHRARHEMNAVRERMRRTESDAERKLVALAGELHTKQQQADVLAKRLAKREADAATLVGTTVRDMTLLQRAKTAKEHELRVARLRLDELERAAATATASATATRSSCEPTAPVADVVSKSALDDADAKRRETERLLLETQQQVDALRDEVAATRAEHVAVTAQCGIDNEEQLRSLTSEFEAQLAALQSVVASKDDTMRRLRESLVDRSELGAVTAELDSLRTSNAALAATIERTQTDHSRALQDNEATLQSRYNQEIDSVRRSHDARVAELEDVRAEFARCQATIAAFEKEHSLQTKTHAEALAALTTEVTDARLTLAASSSDVASLRRDKAQLTVDLERVRAELDSMRVDADARSTELEAQLATQETAMQHRMDELSQQLDETERELAAARRSDESSQRQLRELVTAQDDEARRLKDEVDMLLLTLEHERERSAAREHELTASVAALQSEQSARELEMARTKTNAEAATATAVAAVTQSLQDSQRGEQQLQRRIATIRKHIAQGADAIVDADSSASGDDGNGVDNDIDDSVDDDEDALALRRLAVLSASHHSAVQELERLQSEYELATQRAADDAKRIEHLDAQAARSSRVVSELEGVVAQLEAELKYQCAQAAQHSEHLERDIAVLQQQTSELQSAVDAKTSECAQQQVLLDQHREHAQHQVETLRDENAALTVTIASIRTKMTTLEAAKAHELDALSASLDALETRAAAHTAALSEDSSAAIDRDVSASHHEVVALAQSVRGLQLRLTQSVSIVGWSDLRASVFDTEARLERLVQEHERELAKVASAEDEILLNADFLKAVLALRGTDPTDSGYESDGSAWMRKYVVSAPVMVDRLKRLESRLQDAVVHCRHESAVDCESSLTLAESCAESRGGASLRGTDDSNEHSQRQQQQRRLSDSVDASNALDESHDDDNNSRNSNSSLRTFDGEQSMCGSECLSESQCLSDSECGLDESSLGMSTRTDDNDAEAASRFERISTSSSSSMAENERLGGSNSDSARREILATDVVNAGTMHLFSHTPRELLATNVVCCSDSVSVSSGIQCTSRFEPSSSEINSGDDHGDEINRSDDDEVVHDDDEVDNAEDELCDVIRAHTAATIDDTATKLIASALSNELMPLPRECESDLALSTAHVPTIRECVSDTVSAVQHEATSTAQNDDRDDFEIDSNDDVGECSDDSLAVRNIANSNARASDKESVGSRSQLNDAAVDDDDEDLAALSHGKDKNEEDTGESVEDDSKESERHVRTDMAAAVAAESESVAKAPHLYDGDGDDDDVRSRDALGSAFLEQSGATSRHMPSMELPQEEEEGDEEDVDGSDEYELSAESVVARLHGEDDVAIEDRLAIARVQDSSRDARNVDALRASLASHDSDDENLAEFDHLRSTERGEVDDFDEDNDVAAGVTVPVRANDGDNSNGGGVSTALRSTERVDAQSLDNDGSVTSATSAHSYCMEDDDASDNDEDDDANDNDENDDDDEQQSDADAEMIERMLLAEASNSRSHAHLEADDDNDDEDNTNEQLMDGLIDDSIDDNDDDNDLETASSLDDDAISMRSLRERPSIGGANDVDEHVVDCATDKLALLSTRESDVPSSSLDVLQHSSDKYDGDDDDAHETALSEHDDAQDASCDSDTAAESLLLRSARDVLSLLGDDEHKENDESDNDGAEHALEASHDYDDDDDACNAHTIEYSETSYNGAERDVDVDVHATSEQLQRQHKDNINDEENDVASDTEGVDLETSSGHDQIESSFDRDEGGSSFDESSLERATTLVTFDGSNSSTATASTLLVADEYVTPAAMHIQSHEHDNVEVDHQSVDGECDNPDSSSGDELIDSDSNSDDDADDDADKPSCGANHDDDGERVVTRSRADGGIALQTSKLSDERDHQADVEDDDDDMFNNDNDINRTPQRDALRNSVDNTDDASVDESRSNLDIVNEVNALVGQLGGIETASTMSAHTQDENENESYYRVTSAERQLHSRGSSGSSNDDDSDSFDGDANAGLADASLWQRTESTLPAAPMRIQNSLAPLPSLKRVGGAGALKKALSAATRTFDDDDDDDEDDMDEVERLMVAQSLTSTRAAATSIGIGKTLGAKPHDDALRAFGDDNDNDTEFDGDGHDGFRASIVTDVVQTQSDVGMSSKHVVDVDEHELAASLHDEHDESFDGSAYDVSDDLVQRAARGTRAVSASQNESDNDDEMAMRALERNDDVNDSARHADAAKRQMEDGREDESDDEAIDSEDEGDDDSDESDDDMDSGATDQFTQGATRSSGDAFTAFAANNRTTRSQLLGRLDTVRRATLEEDDDMDEVERLLLTQTSTSQRPRGGADRFERDALGAERHVSGSLAAADSNDFDDEFGGNMIDDDDDDMTERSTLADDAADAFHQQHMNLHDRVDSNGDDASDAESDASDDRALLETSMEYEARMSVDASPADDRSSANMAAGAATVDDNDDDDDSMHETALTEVDGVDRQQHYNDELPRQRVTNIGAISDSSDSDSDSDSDRAVAQVLAAPLRQLRTLAPFGLDGSKTVGRDFGHRGRHDYGNDYDDDDDDMDEVERLLLEQTSMKQPTQSLSSRHASAAVDSRQVAQSEFDASDDDDDEFGEASLEESSSLEDVGHAVVSSAHDGLSRAVVEDVNDDDMSGNGDEDGGNIDSISDDDTDAQLQRLPKVRTGSMSKRSGNSSDTFETASSPGAATRIPIFNGSNLVDRVMTDAIPSMLSSQSPSASADIATSEIKMELEHLTPRRDNDVVNEEDDGEDEYLEESFDLEESLQDDDNEDND